MSAKIALRALLIGALVITAHTIKPFSLKNVATHLLYSTRSFSFLLPNQARASFDNANMLAISLTTGRLPDGLFTSGLPDQWLPSTPATSNGNNFLAAEMPAETQPQVLLSRQPGLVEAALVKTDSKSARKRLTPRARQSSDDLIALSSDLPDSIETGSVEDAEGENGSENTNGSATGEDTDHIAIVNLPDAYPSDTYRPGTYRPNTYRPDAYRMAAMNAVLAPSIQPCVAKPPVKLHVALVQLDSTRMKKEMEELAARSVRLTVLMEETKATQAFWKLSKSLKPSQSTAALKCDQEIPSSEAGKVEPVEESNEQKTFEVETQFNGMGQATASPLSTQPFAVDPFSSAPLSGDPLSGNCSFER